MVQIVSEIWKSIMKSLKICLGFGKPDLLGSRPEVIGGGGWCQHCELMIGQYGDRHCFRCGDILTHPADKQCGECGKRQVFAHIFCTECGTRLPERAAIRVAARCP